MNFDTIENLSGNEILKLYDNVVDNVADTLWEASCTCANGYNFYSKIIGSQESSGWWSLQGTTSDFWGWSVCNNPCTRKGSYASSTYFIRVQRV